jgi:hypothetical protein
MNDVLQINTRVRRLFHYIDDFQKGLIRVPAFQRDFIWEMKGKLDLLDSIKKGYPIGSILFWRPDFKSSNDFEQFEAEKIGSYYIPQRKGDYFYILDGYQRISTLFGCLVNPVQTTLSRDEVEWSKEFNLVYDLQQDKFEYHKKGSYEHIHKVPLYKFVDSKEFFGFQKELLGSGLPDDVIQDYIQKYENLSSRLVDYQIPSIDIIGATVAEAIDIFSRVNSKGAKITDDWKVSALSFDKDKDFRLGSEIDKLLKELAPYNFDKINRKIIFQCIINSFEKVFFDQSKSSKLDDLAKRTDFPETARETLVNIKLAVKFLHTEVCVLNNKLLPYSNQLIFITDFFSHVNNPSNTQIESLKRWFWITSYSGYFTIYNLAQQRSAYYKFREFIYNAKIDPVYKSRIDQKFVVTEFPKKINMGSVRAKSLVLFMLNLQKIDIGSLNVNSYCKISPMFNRYNNGNFDISSTENNIVQLLTREDYTEQIRIKDFNNKLWYSCNKGLFINEEMKDLWENTSDIEKVLKFRKELIKKKESEFVENLGLIYQ